MARVLFDGMWWVAGPPSGRAVERAIVESWVALYPSDDVTVAVPTGDVAVVKAEVAMYSASVDVIGLRPQQHLGALLGLSRHTSTYDALLTQNFGVRGRGGCRSGVFVHDMMFLDRPEWFGLRERLYLGMVPRLSGRADEIFTSSLSEARRIERHLGREVCPVGLGLSSRYAEARPARPTARLPDRFLLSVGRLNVRKNLATLCEVVATDDRCLPLVIVGSPDGRVDSSVRTWAADPKVTWLGAVSDSELKWLYGHASALIFPSFDEGFGLPVLEALDSGLPIALSDIPAFREFGLIGSYFDPLSPIALRAAIRSVQSIRRSHPPASIEMGWAPTVNGIRRALLGG